MADNSSNRGSASVRGSAAQVTLVTGPAEDHEEDYHHDGGFQHELDHTYEDEQGLLEAMEHGQHAHDEAADQKLEEELMHHHGVQFDEPALNGAAAGAKKASQKSMKSKKRGDKKPLLKSWLCIMSTGETSVLQADKYKLTAQLGIQTRDLRLLDPQMQNTYPSAILCRDKSIVVNLEHIKVIITIDRVLVINHEDEGNAKFVEDLKQRIAHPAMSASKSFPSGQDLQRMERLAMHTGPKGPGAGLPALGMSAQLPFELRVLEVCLDELASEYDVQTTELEAAAYPALDTLAAKVTSPHLERVRRLKNRLVRLTTRVETVREVLEKFLDDDEDMHDLNLTANAGGAGALGGLMMGGGAGVDLEGDHHTGVGAGGGVMAGAAGGMAEEEAVRQRSGATVMRHGSADHSFSGKRLSNRSLASSASTNSSVMESEVAEVEMLLEAYFMHFDNTFNRLTTLNEYIKDTEDLVNIKLDQHRNQLITTDLILTAFTCSMAMVTTIAGIFGMNLDSGLQEEPNVFNQVTVASCVGAVLIFVAFVMWAWRYGLLVFN